MNQIRPPVVVVLGHVDHGKTSLLDSIRKTNLAGREAGGITQGIGASEVITKDGKRITFIDTPGHAAFSKMRSRGAKLADIAILVVSADDGVKPQTQEALNAIRQAEIPFLVAITKIDLPSADIEAAVKQLEKEGVLFEGTGGNIPRVAVSAKKSEGIENLLDIVSLLAEVSGLTGKKEDPLSAVVIETTKDKRGLLVSVVVKDGRIGVGQTLFAQGNEVKIKGIFNWLGKPIKEILPGEAAQLLGFSQLPEVGVVLSGEKNQTLPTSVKEKSTREKTDLLKGKLMLSLKAQTKGALEALIESLPPGVAIVASEVGDVNESDVLSAKASHCRVFAFESKISSSVAKLAEAEGVKIERFTIIYELLDRINEILKSGEEEILGKAEIIASFPFNNKKIAGCRMVSGKIGKTDKLTLLRGEKEIGKIKAISLKKQKQEVNQVGAGEEFGLLFEPQLDFKLNDVIVSVANG